MTLVAKGLNSNRYSTSLTTTFELKVFAIYSPVDRIVWENVCTDGKEKKDSMNKGCM